MTDHHAVDQDMQNGSGYAETRCPYCGTEIMPDEDRGGAIECCPRMAEAWWGGATDLAHDEGVER